MEGTSTFGFNTPLAAESTGQAAAENSSGLPSWLQTLGGVVGLGVNAFTKIEEARKPKPLSNDYTADKEAREREAYKVPRNVDVPTWMIVGGVLLGVGVLVALLKD